VGEDVAFTAVRLVFEGGDVAVAEFIVSTQEIIPPVEPTEEPTEPTEEPTEPTQEPTEPTGEPTEPTARPTPPTQAPTTAPPSSGRVDVYGEPGYHNVNGRFWYTA